MLAQARATSPCFSVSPGFPDRILRVYLPSALPSIFAGLRVALPIGLVMVVRVDLPRRPLDRPRVLHPRTAERFYSFPDVYGGILFPVSRPRWP